LFERIVTIGSFLGFSVGTYVFYNGTRAGIWAVSFGNSMNQISAIPISLNFASEITFPQEAAVINGFLLMSGRLAGFITAS